MLLPVCSLHARGQPWEEEGVEAASNSFGQAVCVWVQMPMPPGTAALLA